MAEPTSAKPAPPRPAPPRSAPSAPDDPMQAFADLPPAVRTAIEDRLTKSLTVSVRATVEREIRSKIAKETAGKLQRIFDFLAAKAPASMFNVFKATILDLADRDEAEEASAAFVEAATEKEIPLVFERDGSFRLKSLFSSLTKAACGHVLLVSADPPKKIVKAIVLTDATPLRAKGLADLSESERTARLGEAAASRAAP